MYVMLKARGCVCSNLGRKPAGIWETCLRRGGGEGGGGMIAAEPGRRGADFGVVSVLERIRRCGLIGWLVGC